VASSLRALSPKNNILSDIFFDRPKAANLAPYPVVPSTPPVTALIAANLTSSGTKDPVPSAIFIDVLLLKASACSLEGFIS